MKKLIKKKISSNGKKVGLKRSQWVGDLYLFCRFCNVCRSLKVEFREIIALSELVFVVDYWIYHAVI